MAETKILLSFAMLNHGSNFAHWLRDRLMKHYQLYDVKSVYLDSVVARSGKTEHATSFGDRQPESDVALVSPDYREKVRSRHNGRPTGAHPIGARRKDWNDLYQKAMSEANAMVFIYTSDFPNSEWCLKEWNQYIDETNSRPHFRPLKGIVLEFDDCSSLVAQGAPNVTRVKVSKQMSMGRGLAWDMADNGDFIISESGFLALTRAIGGIRNDLLVRSNSNLGQTTNKPIGPNRSRTF